MNYQSHYNNLIKRAINRTKIPGCYYEKHHVVPRCLGGDNSQSNLVYLTGREHYIAHQLLVKIYPTNRSLIKAANRMCSGRTCQNRSGNRLYDWLRRKLAQTMRQSQSGSGNSQYGKIWIHNVSLNISKKIYPTSLDEHINQGWKPGRVKKTLLKICSQCNSTFETYSRNKKFCSTTCKKQSRPALLDVRKEELITLYNQYGNMNKALKAMGLPGAVGAWLYEAKKILGK